MKKGKAILSILLAGMMVLGAAGCGGKEKSADDSAKDSTSKSSAESTDSGSLTAIPSRLEASDQPQAEWLFTDRQ